MTYARSEIYEDEKIGVYHCVSRCVRRAYLCGLDKLTGKSFEHRREWIRNRLSFLTEIFAIEVVSYAVMSNHLHSLVRNRPDIVDEWDDREVAVRWRNLFPRRKKKGQAMQPNEEEIEEIISDKKLVELYRRRLSNISWFHRCLNERIARMSNLEDGCKGRFWEGRFKCQRVFDISGILACSVYIDLNPIRAGIAKTPEQSDFTSVQERIKEYRRSSSKKQTHHKLKHQTIVPLVNIEEITQNAISLEEYLDLVDKTGRLIVQGKANITKELIPILTRLNISSENWLTTTKDFKIKFKRVVGPKEYIVRAAERIKKCWFHGIKSATQAFA